MKRSTKVLIGVAAAGGVATLLALLLRRKYGDPSEWALPTFRTTQSMLSPAPLVEYKGVPQVEVIPVGMRCTSSSQCGDGVCVNGSCVPREEWEA